MNKQQEDNIIESAYNSTTQNECYKLELKLLQEIRDLLKKAKK